MILTKKQLRRRIEQSAIPARLHSIAFAEITKHKRIMWETELIKADKAYKDAEAKISGRIDNPDYMDVEDFVKEMSHGFIYN